MQAVLASGLVLALFAAAAALTLLAFAAPRARMLIATLGATGALALGFHHIGGFSSPNPAMFPQGATEGPQGTACKRAIALLEQNRVLLDRSRPGRVVVARALWAQIPSPTQQILIGCFRPLNDPDGAVEIVQR